MAATTIQPPPTRREFVAALDAADIAASRAARTRSERLMLAARHAQREAWLALEDFDRHGYQP